MFGFPGVRGFATTPRLMAEIPVGINPRPAKKETRRRNPRLHTRLCNSRNSCVKCRTAYGTIFRVRLIFPPPDSLAVSVCRVTTNDMEPNSDHFGYHEISHSAPRGFNSCESLIVFCSRSWLSLFHGQQQTVRRLISIGMCDRLFPTGVLPAMARTTPDGKPDCGLTIGMLRRTHWTQEIRRSFPEISLRVNSSHVSSAPMKQCGCRLRISESRSRRAKYRPCNGGLHRAEITRDIGHT